MIVLIRKFSFRSPCSNCTKLVLPTILITLNPKRWRSSSGRTMVPAWVDPYWNRTTLRRTIFEEYHGVDASHVKIKPSKVEDLRSKLGIQLCSNHLLVVIVTFHPLYSTDYRTGSVLTINTSIFSRNFWYCQLIKMNIKTGENPCYTLIYIIFYHKWYNRSWKDYLENYQEDYLSLANSLWFNGVS